MSAGQTSDTDRGSNGPSVNAVPPIQPAASALPGKGVERPTIVSVNSRGGKSSNLGAKVAFGLIVFGVLLVGALWTVNKWRQAAKEERAAASAAGKAENKPAQVGIKRKFDSDPPVPAIGGSRGGITTQATASCADGSPGSIATLQGGGPMLAANGQPIRICPDGKLLLPTGSEPAAGMASAGQAAAEGPPPPIGVKTTGGPASAGAAGNAPPPSRYGGDVMVPVSTQAMAGAGAASAPTAQETQLALLRQLVAGRQPGGMSGAAAAQAAAMASGPGEASGRPVKGSVGEYLTGSQTPTVQAAMLSNPSLILPKGRSIDCSLTTRVISEVAGLATCVLTSDVYSADGHTKLLDKGSEVSGEYAATMTQGQRRLFLLWTRVLTGRGVTINVASPAADALGTAGIDGYVDNHWWERLGAAFLLSLVQDAISYKISSDTGSSGTGGGVQVFQNTAQTGNNMAEKVLDSTINIKPTLYKMQGDRVSIMVARDLDFSTVYALRAR